MTSWPKRDAGWEEALIARTRALLVEAAERFDLRYEWDETAPVDIACTYPAQPGLDFRLDLFLSGDEFYCGGDGWYATFFPADGEKHWDAITRLVEGLITGEARVALYRSIGRRKPYWTEVQLRHGNGWKTVSTGAGCAFPPIIRPSFLRNGHAPQSGTIRPAYGTIVLLLLLLIGAYRLFA